jgi:hypothetical protein
MDLSPTWKPSDDKIFLPPFQPLQEIEDDGVVPDMKGHKLWAKRTLVPLLSSIPKGEGALWMSVLTLWRLKYLENELKGATEEFVTTWQLFASTWLVCSPLVRA